MDKQYLYQNLKRSSEVKVNHLMEETFQHTPFSVPIHIYLDEYDKYMTPMIARHWHPEIQIAYVLEGSIEFAFQDKTFLLSQGEAIFINSNVIHMSVPQFFQEGKGISILFHADYIGDTGNSTIHTKYIKPFTDNKNFSYIPFYKSVDWHREILCLLEDMLMNEAGRAYGYELAIRNDIGMIWLTLIRNSKDILPAQSMISELDNERIQKMLGYIHENYMNPMRLEDIAKAANISISECCRCFKRVVNMTPFQFLIQRRIKAAAQLLLSTRLSVLEITYQAGFNSPNYFIKQFKAVAGCTPMAYRKGAQT